jgi:hypothetical protein
MISFKTALTVGGIDMRTNLTKAFSKLRQAGFFARQNFQCCQSCGCAAIPEGVENYVFYHSQDREDLRESGSCYLAFGGDGHKIVKVLNEAGVRTEWNGSDSQRIRMFAEVC